MWAIPSVKVCERITKSGVCVCVQGEAGISDFPLQTLASSLTSSRLTHAAEGPLRAEAGRRGEEGRGQGLVPPQQLGNSEEALAQTKEGEAAEGRQAVQPWPRYLVSRFADIRPIPSDTPFEKPRAAVAGVDPVVFPRAAVATHFTGDI